MPKLPTGILGFDLATDGGLPRGRTTLVEGGPGSGKTIFGLQTLVNGAREFAEPGIFVAFEERPQRIIANAATFGWDLEDLQRQSLFFLDAQPSPNLVQSGSFDLNGLLAALDVKAAQMEATRIVFDAIDIVLDLLPDDRARRREIFALHDWLLNKGWSAIITSKVLQGSGESGRIGNLGFMQFMVDCSVHLGHDMIEGVSHRSLRVTKYRGTDFEENSIPLVIDRQGIALATGERRDADLPVSNERISSGVERLDTMLGGGYFRGASILVTGEPGTAKTTLCGAFAEAACTRAENVLYVSFDSSAEETARNLSSVGIDLKPHIGSGRLKLTSASGLDGSAELHLIRIQSLAREHGAQCLVIDPISALAQGGNRRFSHSVAERLIRWGKSRGITLMSSSLLDQTISHIDGTPVQISTIADTWIQLSFLARSGERNRALSIAKSRGTRHSNQVREMVLSEKGVTLTDVYLLGGEVMMGTLRHAAEQDEREARRAREAEAELTRSKLDAEVTQLEVSVSTLLRDLEFKRAELARLDIATKARTLEQASMDAQMRERRSGDASSHRPTSEPRD